VSRCVRPERAQSTRGCRRWNGPDRDAFAGAQPSCLHAAAAGVGSSGGGGAAGAWRPIGLS